MKRFCLVLLLVLISVAILSQPVILLQEGFEGAFPADRWSLEGEPTWDDSNFDKQEGGWAAWCAGSGMSPERQQYADNMNATMFWGPFSLSDYGYSELSFWYKNNSESGYDFLKVGIYRLTDGDWVWNELFQISGSDNDEWTREEISLAEYCGSENLKLAFVFETDGSVNNFSGAWIDDIVISAEETSDTRASNSPAPASIIYLTGDAYEPNNTPDQYTALIVRTVEQNQAHNLHYSADEDWFRFKGEFGKKYTFKSRSTMDPIGTIYNDSGAEVLVSNDDDSQSEDNSLDFRLEFTPGETDWYKLKIVGYNGNTGLYELLYSCSETEVRDPDLYEPNNNSDQATLLEIAETEQNLPLNIHFASDADWFYFDAEPSSIYEFKSVSEDSLDMMISLYDSEGVALTEADDDEVSRNFFLQVPVSEPSRYLIRVYALGESIGNYNLLYSRVIIGQDTMEGNDSRDSASPLNPLEQETTLNLSIHSAIDEDWFRFEFDPSKIYNFYSEGTTDVMAYLYATDQESYLLYDDDSHEQYNFILDVADLEAGSYFLQIKAYDGDIGNYNLKFRAYQPDGDQYEPNNHRSDATLLNIGAQAGSQNHTIHYGSDVDWFAFSAEVGKTYFFRSQGSLDIQAAVFDENTEENVVADDDSGDDNNFMIEFTPSAARTYYLQVEPFNRTNIGNYQLHYYWTEAIWDEYEPDSSADTATRLILSHAAQRQSHTLHSSLDEDWYRFYLTAGRTYRFSTESNLDTMGFLYADKASEPLLENDDSESGGLDFMIVYTPTQSGYYYLKVKPYARHTGEYILIYE